MAAPKDLPSQQQDLRKKLDEVACRGWAPRWAKDLGKAGQAMDQAQKSLNGKDLTNARKRRKTRWTQMRQGADALAKQMQSSGQNGQDEGQEDPLGRGQTGSAMVRAIKLPDANDLARARDILQELRRRAGERGRPPQELDYIDRLLQANSERDQTFPIYGKVRYRPASSMP